MGNPSPISLPAGQIVEVNLRSTTLDHWDKEFAIFFKITYERLTSNEAKDQSYW
jgi:hypothetical protein